MRIGIAGSYCESTLKCTCERRSPGRKAASVRLKSLLPRAKQLPLPQVSEDKSRQEHDSVVLLQPRQPRQRAPRIFMLPRPLQRLQETCQASSQSTADWNKHVCCLARPIYCIATLLRQSPATIPAVQLPTWCSSSIFIVASIRVCPSGVSLLPRTWLPANRN
jgi:hypothetical protein